MNLLIYWTNENGEEELVMPPIEQGVILPGVTRDSPLTLAREWNEFKVTERAVTMKELVDALDQGRVNKVTYGDRVLEIPTMDDGAPLAARFLSTLNDIQYGNSSREGWQVIF